jgi:DNA topoisomerase-2
MSSEKTLGEKTLAEKYQKLDHREHIYKLPDTYIGSIDSATIETFVPDLETDRMNSETITFVPGFFKIFDEILVNATDHRQRDPTVKNIKVSFEKGLSEICIQNDGSGIEVAIHPQTNVYVPEMLFGHLLTSSNYNESERRTTGGKNGYGSKVVGVFSQYFIIETVDATRQLKYIQKFSENNKVIHPPKITKCLGKSYTKITFMPDYPKFNLPEGITEGMYKLLCRRVYDATAVTPKDLNVYLNGVRLKVKSMEKYMELFVPDQKVFYNEQPRWKVGLVLSPNREFQQISFVNGIWTSKGGRHVEHILTQIVDKTKSVLSKLQRTKNKTFKTSQIKDHIWIFVDAVIENPSFTSQTKEEMTSKVSQFGSSWTVDERWVERWVKQEGDSIIERLMENTKLEDEKLLKKTDGSKRSVIKGIPKLEDAIQAGTRNAYKCTLILCEGDSAKASVLAGVSALGSKQREYFGIFPLRGKFINVRDITLDKMNSNEEVKNLKTILGLQHNKVYHADNIKELRYGSVALATDSDADGSHIKGLIMNFFHCFWPSLLQIEGFLKTLYTPIVKGVKTTGQTAGQTVSFYNLNEYHQFKQQHPTGWNYKYFKGLGTSTSKEFKEYFGKLDEITACYQLDKDESLLMAFSKERSDQRKDWLQVYNPEDVICFSKRHQHIPVSEFVHKELKHFSNYDNYRSIPNILDGLKPSQRKVLYGLIKKGNIKEIKVAQLASFVSEVTQYHHGEVSLEQTIVGMAQRFVGKNNLPLLKSIGQFGTRLSSKDYAQSRYIFTALEDYTLAIYQPSDEPLLNYLEDEDKPIEPFCYYPILPMVLVNGAEGIGTGYSTQIPCFNPKEIIQALIQKNETENAFKTEWVPYYKGFKGTITPADETYKKFTVNGVYQVEGLKLVVTELPVGVWTNTFKEHLEHLITTGVVQSYVNKSTDESVHFEIQLVKELQSGVLEKTFKLQGVISLGNMHAYKDKVIHRFKNIKEILDYFYETRLDFYHLRKQHQLGELNQKIDLLSEKIRFIRLVLDQPDIVFRQTRKYITQTLEQKGFKHIDILIQMPIYNWSVEKIQELEKERESLQAKFKALESQLERQLFAQDLKQLEKAFTGFN